MNRSTSQARTSQVRHARWRLAYKSTGFPRVTGLIILLCLISQVEARNSTYWDRDQCLAEVRVLQNQTSFDKNTSEYFLLVNGLLKDGPDMVLTLKGCYEFCGSWSFYWDSGPRITTWIIPVLLLLSNIELSPIDKKRFMTITHAMGDPVDSFWSIIHKIYIWHRLYAIGWKKSLMEGHDSQERDHLQPKKESIPHVTTVLPEIDRPRSERARTIATVLAGFEEVSGARIKSEDYYYMVTHQLGRIGEREEDPIIFEIWSQTARILADARTNEFLRTCLSIFVYVFGLIGAFIPAIGGGNTSPPGGRIGSAIFLSWLVPLALLSNIVGTFTSRRTCLTIMRQFVDSIQRYQRETLSAEAQHKEIEPSIEGVAPNVQAENIQEACGMKLHNDTKNDDTISESALDVSNTHNPKEHLLVKSGEEISKRSIPARQDSDIEHVRWQGYLDPTAADKIDLMRKKTWEEYFESLQWLGAIYTYRPWKVLYLDIDRRTHAHRKNVLMVLAGLFPVVVSTAGAFAIIWNAVPWGFSCRHIWVLGIFVLWLISPIITSVTYIYYRDHPKITGQHLWRRILVKDAIIGFFCVFIIFMSTGGIFNNCWCWSVYMMRRDTAYVPLNTDAEYLENGKHIYSAIVATVIGSQLAFFGILLYWWRNGLNLVRWTETLRRQEWMYEMKAPRISKSDDTFLLFWYNKSQLEREDGLRSIEHIRYSVSKGKQPRK